MGLSKNILIGKLGESLACEYLKTLGYEIIDTNWHYSRNSEIDVIAKDKSTLVFVEVKTRTTMGFGHPFEAITKSKLDKIHIAVLAYISQTNINYKNYRIDAISVLGLNNPKIEHMKNISLN